MKRDYPKAVWSEGLTLAILFCIIYLCAFISDIGILLRFMLEFIVGNILILVGSIYATGKLLRKYPGLEAIKQDLFIIDVSLVFSVPFICSFILAKGMPSNELLVTITARYIGCIVMFGFMIFLIFLPFIRKVFDVSETTTQSATE